MKNVAVLIYDLTVEYHITVVEGILKFFSDKWDIGVFLAPVCAPHDTTYDWDYQYWSTVEVLRSKSIDAVIVIPNSFSSCISVERLSDELKRLGDIPVISVATPLNLENNSYACISSKKVYNDVVKHLVEKHNCKNLAYFSAELNGSPESEERVNSFKDALKQNGLEFHKDWVFPGDFTPAVVHRYILEHYTSKKIPFDALLCANDYMAQGAIKAFNDIGIRVPEDVIVFGFDNASIGLDSVPTLSTIDQHIGDSGYKAAEMAYNAIYGQKNQKRVVTECFPVYRQSCGCVRASFKNGAFIDHEGKFHDSPYEDKNVLNLFGNALNDLASIYHMINMTDTVTNLKDFYESFEKALKQLFIGKLVICLYDHEYDISPEDEFVLPDSAKLIYHYDGDNNFIKDYFEEGGIPFNPKESLMPKECDPGLTRHTYYIVPVALKNMNYGYMLCSLPMKKFTVYEVYLKLFANAFIHSYNYSRQEVQNVKLVEKNRSLNVESRTDELTQVLNRRGFMEYSQRLISLSNVTGTKGCVFFFDMDGLKKINDKWGHKTGDIAIQTVAQVLSDSFHKSDLVGRLSGDEFAAVAPGFSKDNIDLLRERINTLCKEYSEKNQLPFTVSTSMGVAEYSIKKEDLQKLLVEADSDLYEEKKVKHGEK